MALARRQLTARYIGTIAGPIWTVAQPLATVLVFWVVFSLGFRAQGPHHTPFLQYFLPGYIAWLLFAEIVTTSTSAIVGNAYLVKKTVFPVQVLPVVNIVSASVPHIVLIIVTIVFVILGGGRVPLTFVSVVYFYVATLVLGLGLGWLLAAFNVFYRDIEQMVTVLINIWFWATPIAWPATILPPRLIDVLAFNPMFFIVEGYRASLTNAGTPLMELIPTLRFWAVAGILLLVGAQVFQRLKPHFPEML